MTAAAPFHALETGLRAASAAQRAWTPADGPLPALYLSHGAPPLLDDDGWMRELAAWAQSMPKPRGIVIVSAHWESAPLMLSSTTAATPLVYDFGGFDPHFYSLQYPTPDATELGNLVASLMPDAEPLHEHTSRGLDHGAWVPLMVMYPLADIPVVQLSMPTHDPARLLDLGRRLRALREQGVLVIGSGFMTHGLPFMTREMIEGQVPAWSSEFDEWATEALTRGDIDTLAGFRSKAPGMPYAHPTVEHFTPLFVTLGAINDPADMKVAIDGYMWGFSRRSLQFA